MPAYYRASIKDFLASPDDRIVAQLTTAYANDGFVAQYTAATIAWTVTLPALRGELLALVRHAPAAQTWQLLLEFPLYRLRRRIDAVILTPEATFVIEIKTGAEDFLAQDKRQAVEYAQDLRDFHEASKSARLPPILWAMQSTSSATETLAEIDAPGVAPISLIGKKGLANALLQLAGATGFASDQTSEQRGRDWDESPYAPVPSVIDAAVTLFAGHSVREIALASAKNLSEATEAVFSIIRRARNDRLQAVVFLTGVPGAGKTLAGLNIVHQATASGLNTEGDVVYLSGNTPLVVVLREALARDQHSRHKRANIASTLSQARNSTRVTIQHINDFLKQYVHGSSEPPSGHVIVFDEAQRAWDAKQGQEKFGRDASEPYLILETMARHSDWSVTVCLIGLGQEINDGEEGLAGWAAAIEDLHPRDVKSWAVFAPSTVLGEFRGPHSIGALPDGIGCQAISQLHLEVPMRTFRSPELGDWIDAVLAGDAGQASAIARDLSYPLRLTRSLEAAKAWLKEATQGERRMGLLASSGARRLRADGLGETLNATDGSAIAHWYLNPPGDIRSSHALEVPANEYTSQGLELDFACLCWGGDLIRHQGRWVARTLSGNRWNTVSDNKRLAMTINSYRVLLTRAREGLVIWVPKGSADDETRRPVELDAVARYLLEVGVAMYDEES
jgi:hypothetical protein